MKRALPIALVGLLAASCSEASGTPFVVRDLSMLELMVRLNAVHLGMEPYLRSTEHFEDLAVAAEGVAAITGESLMFEWPKAEDFGRDPEPWQRFRGDLERSAGEAAAAARAGDLDGLHAAYTVMDATCIGCHKRYQPTY